MSDDKAYAESLFRACKYRPPFPGAFTTLDDARAWMLSFSRWYNHEPKHRNLKFVSPRNAMRAKREISLPSESPCTRRRARNIPRAGAVAFAIGHCPPRCG